MATTLNFKDIVDLPEWRPTSPAPSTSVVGECLAFDLRNTSDKNPYLWHLAGTTTLEKYIKTNDEWLVTAAYTAVGVTPAAGSGIIFVPTAGPAGVVGATPSPAKITLATLPFSATVGINQFANSGDGVGFKIKVMDNGAGGTGKTEERTIIANTAGATPTVYFDTPLSFTPVAGSTYEMISGRIYILSSGTTAAGYWKAFDIATQTISGNLNVTNLAATIALDFQAVMLDERYVPWNHLPGEGMIDGGGTYNGGLNKCIVATAADGTHITGSGMQADLLADEFKNYIVHIVEDATNPTAVGQRRLISTHTPGATGQFTVAAWAVTPSATAKFVVENNNDLLLWTNGATVTYSYKAGGFAADANWSTAAASGGAIQYANPPAAMGAGAMVESCFSIVPDTAKSARNSHIIWFRGVGTNTMYVLDIAGGANGVWTAAQVYGNQGQVFNPGSCSAHDAATNQGRYTYICVNGTQRFMRFDLLNRVIEPWCYLRFAPSTAVVGGKVATATFVDGATKLGVLYCIQCTSANMFQCLLQR